MKPNRNSFFKSVSSGFSPDMKKYHISWLIGKDEQGLDLSTGITVEAESMLEALAAWSMAHPEIVEPLYIAVK